MENGTKGNIDVTGNTTWKAGKEAEKVRKIQENAQGEKPEARACKAVHQEFQTRGRR